MNALLSILWHYWQTTHCRNFSSRDELSAWQDRQVRRFLRRVLPQSPFYQTYYHGLNLQDWRQFPLINKSIMMANFDRLNTAGITQVDAMAIARQAEESRDFRSTLRGYTVGLSSGTSGNRGLFLVSQAEQQAWAGTILAKALPQSIFSRQRIAFFLRANSNLYNTVQRQRIQFEYFDLFQPIGQHIDRLNGYDPTILVAPASMLRLLAEAKNQAN
ncbi:MAG: F390 synthetase-related protein [Kovacikia sp.]